MAMLSRRRIFLVFLGILALAVLAGFIAIPKDATLRIGSWSFSKPLRLGLDLQGGTHLVYEADVSGIASEDRVSALAGVRDVIERRVNALGVSEPIVQSEIVGEHYRIIADLAGITDVTEAVNLIGETPSLDFRELEKEAAQEETPIDVEAVRVKAAEVLQRAKAGEDFGALANAFSEDPGNAGPDGPRNGDLGFSRRGMFVEKFDQVLFDELTDGTVHPDLVETEFGFHIIKRIESREVDENGEKVLEVHAQHILFLTQAPPTQPNYIRTDLSGRHLKRADVIFDQQTGAPSVQLTFNDEGKELFKQITERNVQQPVGIFLDESPISIPVVQSVIPDGVATITGTFTLEEAKQLAQRLNAGALPVPITLLTQQNIGASLGKISVQQSVVAGAIGTICVILFMLLFYRLPGLLSAVALILYILITFALFKLFSITLTLAGVAGFILSIGMAVDANILIFERMREELRAGQPLATAIEEGFRRAWTSIRDSNVSSLITTLMLLWFGTSLIKGFAITLSIGILVSMFSAITVTRTLLRLTLTRENRLMHWLLRAGNGGPHV